MAKKRMNIQKQHKKLIVKRADELEKMWKSVDMPNFWAEVARKVSKEADTYRIARAKSKARAACIVFF
ncbi:MAG: hypothetical protein UV53_C0002G0012 [Candidatus Azambacteria bacterium GW2011_GWE1_42_9]|nr:MAG: hypothetical protein UU33_C0001G0059 [Candidatus Azambacteria bacterium GW2011_GWF1_41_10]KKS49168.1 MAG: hypothetical protein UV14_C0002G0165 [Candidatus Azambacteria bacterium GW2011_GWF2_42_22]KKS79706.1 MAG: hypothetical protein UV53_C0002G0012 [Candidatus Azambacteria bacterium GW2011_GWE1_42_9]KKT03253.1 MAG: hypothetical protein UV81_C0002G0006 [Candidatus Azambacteria bacterium GW2011_GWD1_43_18]KKT12670.1 MAG: hypothetical protein UV93_C0002G0068 [Candidatus Azambacteria bacter